MKALWVPTAPASRAITVAASLSVAALFVACGAKEKPASQVAAKVNKEEISVHQINFILQRQQGIRPEDADAAGKVILERLIDQELAVQKAEEQKLDRDPQTVQALEAAKREVLARAYQERLTDGVAHPSDDELRAYFASKPALFKERRVYQLDEISIEAPADKVSGIQKDIQSLKSLTDVTSYLKSKSLNFSENQAVRAAEQLPLAAVDAFSSMSEGQNVVSVKPGGLQAIVLLASRQQPVTFETAKPAIEQYLINTRKRESLEKAIKDLRGNSKIEYVGAFANDIPKAGPSEASTVSAPQLAASASLDASTINKGMGIK